MRFSTSGFAAPLALLAVLVVAAGCPDDGASEGEGEAGEGEGEGQSVDVGCDADDACDAGLVCDIATGDCKAGLDCSANPGVCSFCGAPGTNCGFGDAAAFCDASGGDVCRRIKGACDVCDDDAECGVGTSGLPSVCSDGFCAPGCGPCATGFTCEAGGCVPIAQAGSCATAVHCADGATCPDGQTCSDFGVCLKLCTRDVECAAGSFCFLDAGPQQQTCIGGCALGDTVIQDGLNKICHGDGRFGDPCPTPGSADGCPEGTECLASGACERAGCQSSAECPLARTYCDLPTETCLDGCADANDCGAFELCGDDNQCQAQGCRSKDTSCELGQFCCGAELFADAAGCPADIDDGACFTAPDPFCRDCAEDADCADIDAFGFSSFCYELKRQNPDTGEDETIGKFCSTGCRDDLDCPRGVGCQTDLPTPEDGVTTQGCLDAICAGF